MAGLARVHLQLVDRVGDVVAQVASHEHRVGNVRVGNFVLVSRASFLYVVHLAQLGEMLVRLAVELEVGFEWRVVTAQLASILAPDDHEDFVGPEGTSIQSDVLT